MASKLDSFELTSDVEKYTALYVKAFNSGDADAVNAMYTEEAIAVWEPGKPLTGQARKDSIAELMSRGATMGAKVRQSFVTKDTALLVVDWNIDVTSAEGKPVHLEGVGVDVLRLGEDGKWRHAIDDPYGQDIQI